MAMSVAEESWEFECMEDRSTDSGGSITVLCNSDKSATGSDVSRKLASRGLVNSYLH